MSYKIFISHTKSDEKIARVVNLAINNSFEGYVSTYFAQAQIRSGDDWKQKIKNGLEECDAIISIITKNSINKPWIFIEWSSYWMANKKFYVFLSDDVKVPDLVQPMQEIQATFMSNLDSIKNLFMSLKEESKYSYVPWEKAEHLFISIKQAYAEQEAELAEKTYFRYRSESEELPLDDNELEKISLFFYSQKEYDHFKRIAGQIKSDSAKNNLAVKMLRDGQNDYAFNIAKNIRSAQVQAAIVIGLIDNGFDDSKYVRGLLDEISQKSSSHLKEICIHLVEQGKEDSDLFRNIVELMSSMAELRKIAVYFVENKKDEADVFIDIVKKLSDNGSELRKVGALLIQAGRKDSDQFNKIFDSLSMTHQKKLLDEVNRLTD